MNSTTSNAGVTVGRRPGKGGLEVAVGVGVLVGVLVRVGKGVHVFVGVQVAGRFWVGSVLPRGVTVGRGVSVKVAVADGMKRATNGCAAALDRLTKRPKMTCMPAKTVTATITQINTNSRGLIGLLLRIRHGQIELMPSL